MRITQTDKRNLGRFGCAFAGRRKAILVSWGTARQKEAASADIVVRFIYSTCAGCPLLCLVAQFSTTKTVTQMCFFPFDLKNKQHQNYIAGILKKGRIEFCFLSDSREVKRLYELQPRQVQNTHELYSRVLLELKKVPAQQYDFDRAVLEFEEKARVAEGFECLVSEKELSSLIALMRTQAENVAPEMRKRAAGLAKRLIEVFASRYDENIREQVKQLPSYRRVFLFLSDLDRHFDGNYPQFIEFVSNTFAAQANDKNIRELEGVVVVLESIFSLFDHVKQSPDGDEASREAMVVEFQSVVGRMAGGQGLSLGSLKGLLSMFGFPVGGKPGRTPKDYSSEYTLKASGFKWREIAEQTLQNDSETQLEFNGRRYKELNRGEQETLKHRVREGVRSYAKRTGKAFPPTAEKNSELVS